jgi:pimeloyl-ACP methyl ester carboxylesterase
MAAERVRGAPVLVALPGTMCSPEVFEPLAAGLDGEVTVDPVSWLTQPGPWDIPAVAARVAALIEARWGRPVLVCGHSTGGAVALQLAVSHPATVAGLLLVDTGAACPPPRTTLARRFLKQALVALCAGGGWTATAGTG